MHFIKSKKYNEDDIREFEIDLTYYDLKSIDRIAKCMIENESYAHIVIEFDGIMVLKTPFNECTGCGDVEKQLQTLAHLVITIGNKLRTVSTRMTVCLNGKCNCMYMTADQMRQLIPKIQYVFK